MLRGDDEPIGLYYKAAVIYAVRKARSYRHHSLEEVDEEKNLRAICTSHKALLAHASRYKKLFDASLSWQSL